MEESKKFVTSDVFEITLIAKKGIKWDEFVYNSGTEKRFDRVVVIYNDKDKLPSLYELREAKQFGMIYRTIMKGTFKMNEKREIDILKKAYQEDLMEVEIDLGGCIALLSFADFQDLNSKRNDEYYDLLKKYKEQGLDAEPIKENEWRKNLERSLEGLEGDKKTEREKDLEENKPRNLAEQRAASEADMSIMKKILPTVLRSKATGLKMFTDEEAAEFGRLVLNSRKVQGIMNDASQKLIAMFNEVNEMEETAKNFKAQE